MMAADVADIDALASRIGSRQRLLGLDLGTKTIGLALSDVERRIATPLEVVRRRKFSLDAAGLLAIAARLEIGGFVVGLPLNMDGTEGPRAQSTRAFVANLGALTPLPFLFWDERWSTAAVTRCLIEQDISRAKRAVSVDKLAAAYILQGALDRMNRRVVGIQRPGPGA
jgi:putative Holliday junction resolvase